tara:strand:- start:3789 stop:3926 length:138 start_codon:yes stop_codon:yes gene_type:complete
MAENKKSAFRKKIDQLKINKQEKEKEEARKKGSKYFKSNTVGSRR